MANATVMVYSEGTTAQGTMTGQAQVTTGVAYFLTIEVLRNDMGSSGERVTAIRVDGVDIGGCNATVRIGDIGGECL